MGRSLSVSRPVPHALAPPPRVALRYLRRQLPSVHGQAPDGTRRPRAVLRRRGADGGARHLVDRRPEPEPRHRPPRPQRARPGGCGGLRPRHADPRPRGAGLRAAPGPVGRAADARALPPRGRPAHRPVDHRLLRRERGGERAAAHRPLAATDRPRGRGRRRAARPGADAGRRRVLAGEPPRRLRLCRHRHPQPNGRLPFRGRTRRELPRRALPHAAGRRQWPRRA